MNFKTTLKDSSWFWIPKSKCIGSDGHDSKSISNNWNLKIHHGNKTEEV